MDEINAHRLRVNYGPHLVRVTRQDMQAWMPDVRPAKPLGDRPRPRAPASCSTRSARADARPTADCSRSYASSRHSRPAANCSNRRSPNSPEPRASCSATWASSWTPRVDPETLTHSQAALAKALVRQGLVAEAMRGGGDGLPLLRGITAQTLAGVAARGAGDRVRRARLVPAPARPHPRANATAWRRTSPTARSSRTNSRRSSTRFTSGEFPVLCLSRIGAEGHNLQNASVHRPPGFAVAAVGPRAARRQGRTPGRRARLGADLHPLHPRRRRRAHRLDPLPPRRRAPRRARLIRGRRRQPIHHRHPARRRSPARSPTPSKTPATPPPPPASGSPPACSAPDRAAADLTGREARRRTPITSTKGGRA